MIHSNISNKHLTQVAYKVIVLIFALSIITFVFISIPDSTNIIFYGMVLIVLIGILFFNSYKHDFDTFSEEMNYVMQQNNVFASIINTAYSALLITDGEEISYHNKAARVLFRKSNRFLETCSFSDLIYPSDLSKMMEYIKQGIEADSIVVRINTFNNFENEFIYCQVSLKKHHFNYKEQYIVNLTDITEYFSDSNYKLQTISLYEDIFNKLPQELYLFDTRGRLTFKNQMAKNANNELNFLDIIEYDINKNLLRTGFEIAVSGDIFTDTRIISRKFAGQDVGIVEEWGNISLTPVQSEDNTQFVTYTIDNITALKQQISELDDKLKVYSLEFNKANLATVLWDTDGNFLHANDTFHRLFGISENIMKQISQTLTIDKLSDFFNFNEIVFLDDNKQSSNRYTVHTLSVGMQKFFDKVNTTQDFEMYVWLDKRSAILNLLADEQDATTEQYSGQLSNETGDIWLLANVHSLTDANGQFYATAINFLNISKYMEAQNKHNINVSYLKAIANNFYAGIIFIIDSSYQIVFWGGEEKIKQKINISNDVWMRTAVHLSTIPELEKYKDNILLSLKGNYSKLTISIFKELYDFQFFPIRNDNDKVEFCMGIGFNVTDRSEFEKQLLIQKHFLDKIFAESQIPQVILDVTGKIDRANIQYYQIAGITAERLHKTSVYDETSWLNKDIIVRNFERTLNGETTRFEITETKRFTMLDDDEVEEYLYVLSCKGYPILDNNNNVTHVIFNFIDISDTRMLIESMRKSNSINSIVTSNYPEGLLMILDKHKNFILFEGREEIEMLKLQDTDIIGNNIKNIDNIPIINIIKPQIERAFKIDNRKVGVEQKINFDFSIDLIQDDKFPITLDYEANLIPILDVNNDVENVFICINNITNRKQLEKTILEFNLTLEQEVVQRTAELKETTSNLETYVIDLQSAQNKLLSAQQELSANLNRELELNQMKSRFISLMSHEFRTPLTIIQTYTYLLESYYKIQSQEKFQSGMNTIFNAINVITKLLDNILFLDMVKDQTLTFDLMDIVAFTRNIIDEIVVSEKAEQKININTNANNATMYTDSKMLRQIVSNIISNAIKYSPKTSEININIYDSEASVSLEVQDFGEGIADDVVDRIFDTFVRSQNFTNISGTGLGLAIAKNCTDILQGDIRFETEKGEGTTFFVTLPKHSLEDLKVLEQINLQQTAGQSGTILKSIDQNKLKSEDDFIISDSGIIMK